MLVEHRQHLVDEVRLVELAGADIHRQREMGRLRPGGPGRQLGAGGFQHPVAQGQDQAGFLGQGNELGGRHQAALGMLPAQQRLGAGQAAIAVHLGLVVKDELLFLHRLAQVGLQGGAVGDHGLHLRIEEAQGVAAGRLGLVHGQIGLFQQFVDGCLVIAEQGDADARACCDARSRRAGRAG